MSQRTENQVAEMKKQTIGVEVEMNSITREKAARLAATFFGTGRYENTACRNGYSTWSAWDESGREWKFQKDVSIAGPDSEKCEMVTPILTYADMETLQELIRRLRRAGARSDATRGCGGIPPATVPPVSVSYRILYLFEVSVNDIVISLGSTAISLATHILTCTGVSTLSCLVNLSK